MSEERTKILNMLADGKISVDEAEKLLNAIGEKAGKEESSGNDVAESTAGSKKKPQYLIVNVNSAENEHGKPEKVNVRVPLKLLRAGVKLASVMPNHASEKIHHKLHEKGVNFDLDNLNPENMEELIEALSELTVDVDEGKETVRVYCE